MNFIIRNVSIKRFLLSFLMAGLCFAAASHAQVPLRMHYQGRLFDSTTGMPESGTFPFRFRLVDTGSGEYENLYWTETQQVNIEDGFYEVELGAEVPIPAAIFSATEVYLEIQISTDPPLEPRQKLLTVPYAFNSLLIAGKSADELVASASLDLHFNDPSAHHAKTTDAAEIISGVFSEQRIPSSIARQEELNSHINDQNNPHNVDLTQAAGLTRHDDLLGAEGFLGHETIEDHILGKESDISSPLNDHKCPDDMIQVGAACMDTDIQRQGGDPLELTWFEAAAHCASENKRLCASSEWYAGCEDRENLDLDNIGSLGEWVDQWASDITSTSLRPVYWGLGGCESSRAANSPGEAMRFRCCR